MKALGLLLLVFGFALIVVLAWMVERKTQTDASMSLAILGALAASVLLVVASRLVGGYW